MKLLCDVCENAVASLFCCADEAALCLPCDSRIHAANKLAVKHQRIPVLAESLEPSLCDVCQDQPSFFFCIEDRALLCRKCDALIHSVNALAAKHRRFLLTGIQVGSSISNSPSPVQTSAISLEQYVPSMSPSHRAPLMAVKKPADMQASAKASIVSRGMDSMGLCEPGEQGHRASKRPFKPAAACSPEVGCGKDMNAGPCIIGTGSDVHFSSEKSSASGAATARTSRSYMMNKQGTLSIRPYTDSGSAGTSNNSSSNSTTISIRRISAGQVPFVAPVLSSSLSTVLKQEDVSASTVSDLGQQEDSPIKGACIRSTEGGCTRINLNSDNISRSVTMDGPQLEPSDNASDFLVSGVTGWRFDELLTDLIGVCESGPSLSPPKEGDAPGSGIQEDPSWYAELDFMAEQNLSPSQEEGDVALVPEIPSPPTASGMVTSHCKLTCPAASQPWEFDYLFADAHDYPSEFSVVPDIDGGGCRSSPTTAVLYSSGGNSRKKRKIRLQV